MVELRTLGSLELKGDDGRDLLSILAQPRRIGLLAYLAAAQPRGFHRRDTLVGLFWPEHDQAHARAALRKVIYSLRQALGEGVIVGRGDEDIGLATGALDCDVVSFESMLASGSEERALELYAGDFLNGFFVTGALEFERWVERERAHLRTRAFQAAWRLAEREEAASNGFGAAHWARHACGLVPDDEAALRRLLGLLGRIGDRAGAAAAYETFARRLATDFDTTPSDETRLLVKEICATAAVASAPAADRRSIAVLPFVNLSADADNEYFSDGITEELIHWLTRIGGLGVAARTSSFVFKGKNVGIGEIARLLNVTNVLEGSVRKAGRRLKITAQLIDAASGHHLWSEAYERELDDVFAVQEDIARAIVGALRGHLSNGEAATLTASGTANVAAYELYLKGRFFAGKRTESALRQAVDCFRQALVFDAGFARGYSGLADSYNQIAIYGFMPGVQVYVEAQSAAHAALRLDPALAEGYAALGFTLGQYQWDWTSAERAFKRAIALDPAYASAHQWYNALLTSVGRIHEATLVLDRARELEPLSLAILTDIVRDCYLAREYDCAVRHAHAALEIDPGFARAHGALAMAYLELGQFDEAIAEFETSIELAGGWYPTRWGQPGLARAYALAGREREARALLATLENAADRYVSPEMLALVYAALGERATACAALERALAERSINLVFTLRDPAFDPLRMDPAFQDILERTGLRRHAAPMPVMKQ